MGKKRQTRSGGGKRSLVLSKDENWLLHNKNSPMRVDLTREERKQRRIEKLRRMGVPERELKVTYEIPEGKLQGPDIDPLNTQSCVLITLWSEYRRSYYYVLIFGGGTKQAVGDMEGIIEYIDNRIKPNLMRIHAEIRRLNGEPIFPPAFFAESLANVKVPVPSPQGKK